MASRTYQPHTRPDNAQPIGFKHVRNAQMYYLNNTSENATHLDIDKKTTQLVSQKLDQETKQYQTMLTMRNSRRDMTRYDLARKRQAREQLEERIGTPHSMMPDGKSSMILEPSRSEMTSFAVVPRGCYDCKQEMERTGAHVEMAHREFPPSKSLAHMELYFRVKGDMQAEAMIRDRFSQDHALQNWRRSFVEARRDLTRETFKRRQAKNQALENRVKTWCVDSAMPDIAGCRTSSETLFNSANLTERPSTTALDNCRTTMKGGSRIRTFGEGQSTLCRTHNSARHSVEIAARRTEKNRQRDVFNDVNYDGEYVPHTKFGCVDNDKSFTWLPYNTTPNPGRSNNNLEYVCIFFRVHFFRRLP
jgi:hypothetical protein